MRNGFSPAEVSSLLNAPVLEEHADEAAFLWTSRESAVLSPHYRLSHLALLDERLLAHLQGLRVAGATGLRLATRALGDLHSGTLFVAAWLAFALHDSEATSHTLSIATSAQPLSNALVSALAWHELSTVAAALQCLASSDLPAHRSLSLAAHVEHRAHVGTRIARALRASDPQLRARAMRSVGELGLDGLRDQLEDAGSDPNAACRFWAHWSRALAGVSGAAEAAFEAGDAAQQAGAAVEIAMRAGPVEWARGLIRRLAADAATQRDAIVAAGALGDPACVPWLLLLCDHEALSRSAAESFALITGVDLEEPSLRRDAPDAPQDNEHPDDANSPSVNPQALRDWWRGAHANFAAGTRYLGGYPVSEAAAMRLLRSGTQRQRRSASIELSRLRGGSMLFPVTARADWQQRRLAA